MFAYLMLPLRRRGCVGLKEIGTQHTTLDVFLCACLGVPGLVYAFTAHNELAWLRLLVAVEFFVISFTSVLADGMLRGQSMDASSRDGWMVYDRKTAVMHILTLIAVFIYRGVEGHASRGQLGIAVALGLVSLAIFHRRLHYTFVEQRWRPARICARLWHVGGTVAPLIGLLPRFLVEPSVEPQRLGRPVKYHGNPDGPKPDVLHVVRSLARLHDCRVRPGRISCVKPKILSRIDSVVASRARQNLYRI